jgi:hypothetical protein
MRLIPEPEVKTQDLFLPEKSWIWAEAVSAPLLDEFPDGAQRRAKQKRMSAGLHIAIVSATVLIVTTTYIIMQSRRLSEALHSLPVTTEAVRATPPQPVRSTGRTLMTTVPVRRAPVKVAAKVTAGDEVLTDEKAEAGAPGESSPTWAPATYVLLLSTPRTCSIQINDTPYGTLEEGKTMKVYLGIGSYTIQATSAGDNPAVYIRQLVVRQKNLNHWRNFKISL